MKVLLLVIGCGAVLIASHLALSYLAPIQHFQLLAFWSNQGDCQEISESLGHIDHVSVTDFTSAGSTKTNRSPVICNVRVLLNSPSLFYSEKVSELLTSVPDKFDLLTQHYETIDRYEHLRVVIPLSVLLIFIACWKEYF